ncbi:hypothetical protein CHLRE_01g040150v5 [Chlamydomonas reinhardtii]|uniref:non-specific serine/threonine protein kinase n=1 Tax=Chlamydomonas reinhardtii TaxID=3055 RepID=A8HMH1_CHLRE|nr:uncharacterized protein CHLRE_01g040150v5 [Chlamydomonas reinhardtii]PNW88680.1 hypothetical protein CHLRE_01g040150v5 [Chlamydomonas reinhardtii]|eukprot:XP_001690141.1 predicted protein [Chlamydomonas reinhardtii]
MPNSGEKPLEAREPPKRYTKHELIGQGAQKKVYRAFDEERGIEVAWNEVAVAELARFREKDRQRVFAEIRVLKQLKHKNIMSLYDYWFDEPRFMLVFITEIFPDGTLRQYRRRHKLADVPAIKRWAWQILQGLVYLHGHNPPIIHRDLKCDNIFVDGSSGVVKIGDLGLVTLCKDFSAPQSVLGTPEFMAPELYEEKYDEKVDVYAFGMCLLELATMEYPYSECKNAAQIYKKVVSGTLPASVEKLVSAELRDFVTLCIKHDPATRPEARQLLKHPFFESCRAAAAAAAPGGGGSSGGAPRLMISPSMSLSNPGAEAAAAAAAAAMAAAVAAAAAAGGLEGGGLSPAMSGGLGTPGELSRGHSQRGSLSGAAAAVGSVGGSFSIAAAAGGGGSGLVSGNNTASGGISGAGLIAAAVGGGGGAGLPAYSRTSSAGSGLSIAAAAGGAGGGFGGGDGPVPMGAIAAALTRSQSSASSFGGAATAAAVAAAGSLSPPISAAAGHGLIAAAASPPAPAPAPAPAPMPQLTGRLAQLFAGVTPDMIPPPAPRSSAGGGAPGSIAASLSPPTALCTTSIASSVNTAAYGPGAFSHPPSIGGSPAPSTLATSLDQLHHSHGQGAQHPPLTRQLSTPVGGIAQSLAAAAATAAAEAEAAAQLPAVAAAASLETAAGATGDGGSGGGGGSVHGAQQYMAFALPSINEDQELLHEDMMFDEHGNRHLTVEDDTEDEDGEDGGGGSSTPATGAAEAAEAPGGGGEGGGGGGRSQPVRMQVRSSGKAAVRDMALSFAMSFTNDRGVRKKVGFQYDLQHDTASAIAVEMVENLSLNTAEAEAIAQMIAHEVSRFNRQAPAAAPPGSEVAQQQQGPQQ